MRTDWHLLSSFFEKFIQQLNQSSCNCWSKMLEIGKIVNEWKKNCVPAADRVDEINWGVSGAVWAEAEGRRCQSRVERAVGDNRHFHQLIPAISAPGCPCTPSSYDETLGPRFYSWSSVWSSSAISPRLWSTAVEWVRDSLQQWEYVSPLQSIEGLL